MIADPAQTSRLQVGAHQLGVRLYEEVDSTNRLARELAAAGALEGPTVLQARRQSGGYGRLGRVWHSPEGGLWLTLAWPVLGDAGRFIDGLGLRVGVACLNLVESLPWSSASPVPDIRLKWPNDILINDLKVAGSLCEWVAGTGRRTWLVIGVGINVNNDPAALPEGLRRAPTSLRELLGREQSLESLRTDLCARLVALIDPGEDRGDRHRLVQAVLAHAAGRLWRLDERLTLRQPDGGIVTGVLRGLSGQGLLVLDIDGRRRTMPLGCEVV